MLTSSLKARLKPYLRFAIVRKLSVLLFPARIWSQVKHAWVLRFPRRPLSLHLGCGQRRLPGFVNIDHNHGSAVDYACDITSLPCPRNSAERIESYHVVEHLRRAALPVALRHWCEILRPGGVMIVECPDFDADVQQYLAGNPRMLGSIFGLDRFPGDIHYFGYNAARMTALLREAGFRNIEQRAPQDYHSEFEPCMRFECEK